ncbi:MAG: DNA polymerase III subunit gamma/tau, partial [candidate division NC10 bacterium]
MSYQVLARRWRPQTFDQVVGQEPVTRTLRNALRARRLAHALLFTGPRGVGKTTTARLVAKALNCEKSPGPDPCNACPTCQEIALGTSVDCIEIDAATHTGVDHVRSLQEQLAYHPIRGKSKVYIVDEVHMLSAGAFNALLKTLEEPPPNVLFILATTEPHKVPATIHSRCQRHDFRKIGPDQIRDRLAEIARVEGVRLGEDALALLARAADGSLRDGQSLLDQAIAYCGAEIAGQAVAELLGLVASDALFTATGAIAEGAAGRLLELVEELASRGSDLRLFAGELLGHLRNLLVVKVTAKARQFLGLAPADFERTAAQAEALTVPRLEVLLHLLAQAEAEMRRSGYPRFILEVALVRMAETAAVTALEDLIRRLTELEGRLGGGGLPAAATAP